MKSPYYFIIKPLGDEYNNEVEISGQKIIVNSTVEDHKHVNRLAEVVYAPSRSTKVKSGDIIVVHHNIFRIYYDMKGRAKKSPNYFKDGMYFIDEYQFYLYNDGKEWKSVGNYCFVQPIDKENSYLYEEGTELNTGYVVYDNDYLNDLGVKLGDKVNFTKNSEYEFTINDTVLYRMRTNDICALL
jgi:co-chaperonin GroES (HSP10)